MSTRSRARCWCSIRTREPGGRRTGAGRAVPWGSETPQRASRTDGATGPAEATLSLEPLRVPIAAMVQSTLCAEREVLERIGTDLRAELEHLREWRVREEAMRADQTALYRRAAEEWERAGRQAAALQVSGAHLLSAIQELQAAARDSGAWFWRRAMLAAWLVALTGLGLIGGLCGAVWLALAQH